MSTQIKTTFGKGEGTAGAVAAFLMAMPPMSDLKVTVYMSGQIKTLTVVTPDADAAQPFIPR